MLGKPVLRLLAVLLGMLIGLAVVPVAGVAAQSLPADVAPTVERAPTDRERVWNNGCVAFDLATRPPSCIFGSGDITIALVGDSHLSHFFPAFEAAAKQRGWRLATFFKINCPFADMRVRSVNLGREYTECATWNGRVVDRVNALAPDLVVVAWYAIRPIDSDDATVSRKAAAVARMIGRLDAPVVILADSPISAVDVPSCLSEHPSYIEACATPRRQALRGHDLVEGAAAERAGVPLIDLAPWICVASPCPAVVSKRIVFRDTHHLTATFTRSLGPAVERLVAPLL